jgi:ERF superfamily
MTAIDDFPTTGALFSKLVEVAAAIDEVPKDKRNNFHKYDYTSIEGLAKAVRGELLKRGVLITPGLDEIETRTRATNQGESVVTTAHITYAVIDAETGERLDLKWAGCGDDPADKGLSKALTDARKTFLIGLLNLARGDDTEADEATDQRSYAPSGSVNMTEEAKGMTNAQLNAALVSAGLAAAEKPWGAFMRVPAEQVAALREALQRERANG